VYFDDLAVVHDEGFGDLAPRAAPEIARLLRARGIRGGRAHVELLRSVSLLSRVVVAIATRL